MFEPLGLEANAPDEVKMWAAAFDFDGNSCYPAAAMFRDGTMNEGLQHSGSLTGGCRNEDQLKHANTYCRTVSINKLGVTYSVYMYALYFEKDQVSAGLSAGHRHDWEYVLVWTKAGMLTHASFSAHGNADMKAKHELSFDDGKPNTVKAVYHKESGTTHVMRPAKRDEPAENGLKEWYTPALVAWERMSGPQQQTFNTYNFGKANCPFNQQNFPREITKNIPPGYPGSDEWKQVAGYTGPPSPQDLPAGLVARWLVLGDRDPDRDNREVPLLPGQRAKIVVYLPEPARSKLRFTLKHDKRGAEDRARTERIGHDSVVLAAEDWTSFGKRIYIGDRDVSALNAQHIVYRGTIFGVAPAGFYVDLVRV